MLLYSHETMLILDLLDSERQDVSPTEFQEFSHRMGVAAGDAEDVACRMEMWCNALMENCPDIPNLIAELEYAKEFAVRVHGITNAYYLASESVLAYIRRTTGEVA